MLTIKRTLSENKLLLKLSGTIEEDVDFNYLIGLVTGDLIISCKEILRINSAGVRVWVRYFQELADNGTKTTFIELSPAVVEKINMIPNFCCGAKIESVYAPYICLKCRKQFASLFPVEEIKKVYKNLPEPECPKCSGKTVFDDIEEDYFKFIIDPPKAVT